MRLSFGLHSRTTSNYNAGNPEGSLILSGIVFVVVNLASSSSFCPESVAEDIVGVVLKS